jgi:sugar O-acyltransferase (sialic acid O-acetyltransferase NeuD family)
LSAAPLRIVILGAGGNSLGVIDAIEAANALEPGAPRYLIEGILDDIPGNRARTVLGHRVIGTIDEAARFTGCRFVNGISSVASFRKIPEIVKRTGLAAESFETVIHPRATVAASARVGAGSVILAGSVICPEALVGDHVIVLQNTSVNHHTRVGDFATLSAGVTVLGYVEIGRNAFIGGGSTLVPHCTIGESALVGAGSVVVRDVAAGRVVAGNPARELANSPHALEPR